MIYDAFTYNGEREILKLHLSILAPHVDKFIICEAKTTFSGNKKPLYFFQHQRYFREFWPKIEYYVIHENYSEAEIALAESSPNTKGAAHWKREFLQKESIKKALEANHIQDTDIVFIGDVDEIWNPSSIHLGIYRDGFKLPLRVYAYCLNNRSDEKFWGTYLGHYSDIKNKCLNHLRSDSHKLAEGAWEERNMCGWHFTSMGGLKEVKRKLDDSYTEESYNTKNVQALLPQRHRIGADYLGRNFTFKIDESNWPQYLRDNRDKFKHMLLTE